MPNSSPEQEGGRWLTTLIGYIREGIAMPFRGSTWTVVWERIIEFLFRSDIEYSEFQSCTMALLWGFWLTFTPINYGIRADDGSLLQTLDALRALFPSWAWCIWFLALGTGHLIALAKKLWTAQRFFSFVATCTWLYVAIFLALTNIRMIAVPTTLFFAIGAAWGFLRLRSAHLGSHGSRPSQLLQS